MDRANYTHNSCSFNFRCYTVKYHFLKQKKKLNQSFSEMYPSFSLNQAITEIKSKQIVFYLFGNTDIALNICKVISFIKITMGLKLNIKILFKNSSHVNGDIL